MKNLFVVKLAVELSFTALKNLYPMASPIVAFFQPFMAFLAEKYLNFMVNAGIIELDLSIMSRKVALERAEYREAAIKVYGKVIAKKYTEEEKVEIRKQYLDVIRDFAKVGNGIKP